MSDTRDGDESAEIAKRSVRFVARWDLDKTYLRTEFDTVADLLKTALERPDQKRSVPGAAACLRELGRTGAYIHILSGSPRQMRGKLEEKLRIDRVRWDELTLKPNLSNALRLRFRAMRGQLGYKLPVLLQQRIIDQGSGRGPVHEVLVGDDAEADAFIYSLFGDICAGIVQEDFLREIMQVGRSYSDQLERATSALRRLRREPAVRRILIHLDRQSPPSQFDAYGPRVVPFFNYLQASFVMAQDGYLDGQAVLRVASDLALRHRFDAYALARSYYDLLRRGHVHKPLSQKLSGGLRELLHEGPLATADTLSEMCERMAEYDQSPPERAKRTKTPAQLDYVALAKRHKKRHKK